MSDNSVVESNSKGFNSTPESGIKYVDNELLKPHEAFGKYAASLMLLDAVPQERISSIQEAARRFNEAVSVDRKISLYYHFTDANGARGISEQGFVGRPTDERIYLTGLTPEIARPLASAEDAKGFGTYFKEHKVPQSLREHMLRFVLGMKFKWKYDVQKRLLHKPIVPVGADKLENIVLVATEANSTVLKKDAQGEVYVERPIQTQSDPHFQVFGPYPTPEKEA